MNELDAERRQKILDEKYGVEPEKVENPCPFCNEELWEQDKEKSLWECFICSRYFTKNEDGEFEEEV